ncbi:MAG: aconitase X catalytic domain-containing protein [Burkholderiales bacterium]|nr:aconitase X catalytic domain-containing protein [Burkholderiales bacterium]
MELTGEQQAMADGERGFALQWAIRQQITVGAFFGARRLVPVASCHAAAEIGITGEAGLELLESIAASGARVCVPSVTAACSVDFDRSHRFGVPQRQLDAEQRIHAAMRRMGFIDSSTCINYQSVSPPRFHEHLAWGDTGSVAFANAIVGARSNYEGGPAAIAAALTGVVPEYGFHLDAARRASVVFDVAMPLRGTSDWSALGALIGPEINDYWTVPAIVADGSAPSVDELKHLAASLASFGSVAMFHVVGATPEAATLEDACGGTPPPARRIDREALAAVYARFADAGRANTPAAGTDLVVFSAPQLSLYELTDIVGRLAGRRVAEGVRLIVTVNHQTQAEADRLGYSAALQEAGGELLAGTCFYVMAPALVRRSMGFRTLITPSAKLANILGGAGYRPQLRSVSDCIAFAVGDRAP